MEDVIEKTKTDFRILVIDDNPAIHHDFKKILTSSDTKSGLDALSVSMFGKGAPDTTLPNFQIDTASQGQEGVERIKQSLKENRPYSLSFVDIRMPPGWDGIETIKHIWEVDKDIQIVICTAYSDYSWEETVAHLGKTDNLLILKKPFDNVSVRQLACALTKKWQLLQDSRKFTSSLQQKVADRTVSLQKSLSLVEATLESSDEGILVISKEGKILHYNQKFCSMWDIPLNVLEAKNTEELKRHIQNQLTNPTDFMEWLTNLHKKSDVTNFDVIKFKDGKIFDCYSQPQKVEEKVIGRVLNFRDITEREKLEKELEHQAKHDALTALPNRIVLIDEIRNAIKNAKETESSFAILFLDLDRFKLINDSLSHAAGDAILRLTATRLQQNISTGDVLTRLGGDEFVILLKDIKQHDEIIEKTRKIVKAFQQPFRLSERDITVTLSVGVSVFPKDGDTVDKLLRNADAAMYHVKELGSNNFQFYTTEMNAMSLEKLDQETQLRQALANKEFSLCYQPQFDIVTEKLVAVEALVRWNHPQKGELVPMDFVPVAEETGLIVPIGEWVIRTACKQNKAWQDSGLPPIRVAVNVTGHQLKQQNFVEMIKNILSDTKLAPEYLELELTENIIISSAEVIKVVTDLKELGVAIAIDDFGSGYSSLSYLKNLPLDRLKIDASFVHNIKTERDDEVIIRAIIAVAKNLHLDVLAEGVETRNQLNYLKTLNCDEIQGYYFSEPLDLKEMENLLKDQDINKIR